MAMGQFELSTRQLNGGGQSKAKAERRDRAVDELRAENARRVPCERCSVPVLPEGMPDHLRIHALADSVE